MANHQTSSSGLDLDPEAFREAAHSMVDWITDYLADGARHYPVLAQVEPGEVARNLPAGPPESGESLEAVWRDFEDIVLPGVTHWNHPGFMGYFGITGSAPGILGELLASALNVNGMLWRTCPSATELELVVLGWLRQLIGLPPGFFGFLTDTASVSSMLAVMAAREAAGLDIRSRGMAGRTDLPPLVVYASDQAHSSIAKACIAAGLGLEGFRPVAHDSDYRMDVDALETEIRRDKEAGRRPLAVVATIGTTSTTSVDPVASIADVCHREGLWLHVDAAYAGSAAICPELRWCLDGCEHADSLVFNPHKWLFTPIDASALYTRHADVFRRAFSLVPEYLTTPQTGRVIDLMDYGVQLGRRFRALKLWWIIRTFGAEGLRKRIRTHIEMAQELETWVESHPRLELAAPVPFSVVNFRVLPTDSDVEPEAVDRYNLEVLERINQSGRVFVSHTRLDCGTVLHVAIGNLRTTEDDINACRAAIEEAL